MNDFKAKTVEQERADCELELAWSIDSAAERLESWSREFPQAAFFQYVEQVCVALYQQARADAEALVEQYKLSPLAATSEAENAAAGRVHDEIQELVTTHMAALTDVVARLEWHPTVPDLQRLLDRSPPPRGSLEPIPPQPNETVRQANERMLCDRKAQAFWDLLCHAREEGADAFSEIWGQIMAWNVAEFEQGADEIVHWYHELPADSRDAEQHSLDQAKAALDEKVNACREELTFILDELGTWQRDIGLFALARVGAAIRLAEPEADIGVTVRATFAQLKKEWQP